MTRGRAGQVDWALFRELWFAGVATRVIAQRFGRASYTQINKLARLQGWPPRSRNAVTDAERAASMTDPNWAQARGGQPVRRKKPPEGPAPARRRVAVPPQPLPLAEPARPAPAGAVDLLGEVRQTAGRYRDLADVAARRGLPYAKVLQVWHSLRVAA